MMAADPIPGPAGGAEAKPTARRKSGVVIPLQPHWWHHLAARLIWLAVWLLGASVRYRVDDRTGWFSGPTREKFIFAIWHNRAGLSLALYEHFIRRHTPERTMAALASASRDGGLTALVLKLFRMESVRGSSSRRGPQALRELITCAERGCDLAVTPDGPRGPRYQVKPGVIMAAQLTGLTIVPISYRLGWKIQLKSWDRFQIPIPFSRCEVVAGRALRVPREATEAEREAVRAQLEAELKAITRD
jgi:hypothetical protein